MCRDLFGNSNELLRIRVRLALDLHPGSAQLLQQVLVHAMDAHLTDKARRDVMDTQLDQFIHIQVLEPCLAQLRNVFCRNVMVAQLNEFFDIKVFESQCVQARNVFCSLSIFFGKLQNILVYPQFIYSPSFRLPSTDFGKRNGFSRCTLGTWPQISKAKRLKLND